MMSSISCIKNLNNDIMLGRDQLRSMHSSTQGVPAIPFTSMPSGGTASVSTEAMLAEHRQWLRTYQRDVGLTASAGLGGTTGSVTLDTHSTLTNSHAPKAPESVLYP